MTDRKFTEDELVELLRAYVERMCGKCNVKDLGNCCNSCFLLHISQSADLIERQKKKIFWLIEEIKILRIFYGLETEEKVKDIIPKTKTTTARIKAEAIKEFAERLKEKRGHDFPFTGTVFVEDIDDLVKEMTEDAKHD